MSSKRGFLLLGLLCGCAPQAAPQRRGAPVAHIPAAPPAEEPSAPPSCSHAIDAERLIEDLRAVKANSTDTHYNELLERAGFEPLQEPLGGIPVETHWSLEEAKLEELQLKPEGREVLLSLRFEYGMSRSAARIALLERVGRSLCPVSLELSRDIGGFSCLSDGDPPLSIEHRHIVSASFDTLLVTIRSGTCDGYSVGRGANHGVEVWGFVGDDFEKLFQTETFDAWYTSPIPPLRTLERKLEFSGDPPKSLLVTMEVTCDRSPEHDPNEECEEAHSKDSYTYRNGRYE